MIDARFFIDALPIETSPSLILNFIEALLWYQIYHIEWNIQRVRCNSSNNILIMKTYNIIIDVEAQWRIDISRFAIKHPWITPFFDKIKHSLKVFPVLKETLKRIECGGKWFVVSGRTPTIYHKPEYIELVYKIHSIEYLIWTLECLIDIEKEEANRIQENIKVQQHKRFEHKVHYQKHETMNNTDDHDDQVKDKSLITSFNDESKSSLHKHHGTNSENEAISNNSSETGNEASPSPIEAISNSSSETGNDQEGNEINSLTQALSSIEPVSQDESLYPPENIRVSTGLSPHINMIIDEIIKEINWYEDKLNEKTGLKIPVRADPCRRSTSVKQKHRRIDMLSDDEKSELMKRLDDVINYIIELFPDNDNVGFE